MRLNTGFIILLLVFSTLSFGKNKKGDDELLQKTLEALDKGIEYFHSISTKGGYLYYYSVDLTKRWGEKEADANTIEIQDPGTPAVGNSFIQAFEVTQNKKYLDYAVDAARALLEGQNKLGAWDHTITFGKENKSEEVSFDDNQTQGAVQFLMNLDEYVNLPELDAGIAKALNLFLTSQFENGAWPHIYPKQGNYHDYATFNDACINNCINVMLNAYKNYGKKEYLESINNAANYIHISQLSPPQTGWAQQYNEFLQPAWARSFEPPSLSPIVSLRNINSLMDIYLVTKNKDLLLPVEDGLAWVKSTILLNGLYPRFVELTTGMPLYYDRYRKRVNSVDELSDERKSKYAYEQDLENLIFKIEMKYQSINGEFTSEYLNIDFENDRHSGIDDYTIIEEEIKRVIAEQDSLGRWITIIDKSKKNKFSDYWINKYDGDSLISARVFNQNILLIVKYLQHFDKKN